MTAVLTARERHIAFTHLQLSREAVALWPRQYLDDDAEKECRRQCAAEAALTFFLAASRLEGQYLEDTVTAGLLNAHAPDDCQVVGRSEFEQVLKYAVAMYKQLDEINAALSSKTDSDKLGTITDSIRDNERFNRDYRDALLNMPEIIENNNF